MSNSTYIHNKFSKNEIKNLTFQSDPFKRFSPSLVRVFGDFSKMS